MPPPCPPGGRFHYAICGVTHAQEWETGEGEIGGDGKLVRNPIASSAAGAAVNFSAGLKTVALTVGADWFAERDMGPAIADVTGLEAVLAGKAAAGHGHDFASLSAKPTTLAGYGITDAAAGDHDHDGDYQPIDADLSAIAGLATTIFGRAHLALADAAAARGHAGLGSIAVQAADNVAISGGSITGIVDLAVADGGTGASSAPAARANLGLGSAAVKNVGTSGDVVPLLGGGATSWAAGASFGGDVAISGNATIGDMATDGPHLISGHCYGQSGGTGVTAFRYDGAGGAKIIIDFNAGGNSYLDQTELHLRSTGGSDYALFSADGLSLTGDLDVSGALSVGGSQVAGARRTGWTAPSGTAARSAFDTATVATEALAQRVKALIDDLIAHGLIGG